MTVDRIPDPGFDGLDRDWLRGRDGVKWHRVAPDVLPAWVADMDFPVPAVVRAALHDLVDRADLGYPDWPSGTPLRTAFARRMRERYGWAADPARVRELTDLIQGVQLVLHLGTRPGDGVAVLTPCYPPFLASVTGMGRRLVPVPMEAGPGGWTFDADRFDRDVRATGCRALLLVNPHNPTGRAFTRAELTALADVARRHDLLVLSDEIHADLVQAPHRHLPFAALDDDTAARTVTLTSATKAFNLAGVRTAVAHIGDDRLLAARDAQPPDLFGQVNLLGVAATLAAWTGGDDWLAGVLARLRANRDEVTRRLAAESPRIGHLPPEAGYLSWLDLRALGWGDDPAQVLLDRGRVALSSGPEFGPGGAGFARLNFATAPDVLDDVLTRLLTTVAAVR